MCAALKLFSMRKGPSPLSVHIGMAAAEMSRLTGEGDMHAAEAFERLLRGIHKYQNYSHTIARQDLECIYQDGELRLYALSDLAFERDMKIVLLVPSMINKSYIFHLMDNRSMMQYFAQQGLYPVLLDWGQSTQDHQQCNFDSLMQKRLLPAIDFLYDQSGRTPVHIVAYCMGGILMAAAAQFMSAQIGGIVFLAVPWDFHAGQRSLQQRISFWAPQARHSMAEKAFLDKDWLQSIFASMDPLQTRDKFIRFADMEDGGDQASLFVAIEDWLNDGVDLPSDIARVCIEEWFLKNALCTGTWQICGKMIDLSAITNPCFVIASKTDRLVEFESSYALYDGLGCATLHQPPCGHIGMISGRHAVEHVWKPMSEFFASCKVL